MLSQNTAATDSIQELCGAIHLHTKYSDGGVAIRELIEAARSTGLDYILVTDHMTLRGKHDQWEGWHGPVLTLVGYEHNDSRNLNHYLVAGLDKVMSRTLSPQGYIDEAARAGAAGFLAHPVERRHYFKKYPPFPWTDWDVSGYDGIELWNQMSEWVENLKSWRSYVRIFFPRRFLRGAPRRLLKKWDRLNLNRFVSGVGGVDAHTINIGLGPLGFRIFPIRVELQGIRTHLCFKRPVPRKNDTAVFARVISALRDGRGFISNYRRGDARGTRIVFEDRAGRITLPGKPKKRIPPAGRLIAAFPAYADVRLIRNGEVAQQVARRQKAEFLIQDEGVYRIEAYRNGCGWVYSNPFPLGSYPFG
jgi:hypothetical protein